MQIKESQGYSKTKALEATQLDVELERLKNATMAWKKAGSPMNTKEINKFAAQYLKEKKAVGFYIVVEPAADDTRLRPYTVINEVTTGKRKAKTVYQIKPAEFKVKTTSITKEDGTIEESHEVKVLSAGAVQATSAKKSDAFKTMKELIEETKQNYVIEIVREITEGQKFAGYGIYTPSKSAKMGKFLFCVAE